MAKISKQQERSQIYIDRYQSLVKEVHDLVMLRFKPQILETVRLREQMRLDLMQMKEENVRFEAQFAREIEEADLSVQATEQVIQNLPQMLREKPEISSAPQSNDSY